MKLERLVLSAVVAAGVTLSAEAQYQWSPNKPATGQPQQSVPELRLIPVVKTWGETPQGEHNDDTDILLTNQEFSYTCTFSGKLAPEAELTQRELDDHARRLEKRDFFERLEDFLGDHVDEFAWARLFCVNRWAAEEVAQRREREDKAIERAEKARERRRASNSELVSANP
jgi:hypothetical protein